MGWIWRWVLKFLRACNRYSKVTLTLLVFVVLASTLGKLNEIGEQNVLQCWIVSMEILIDKTLKEVWNTKCLPNGYPVFHSFVCTQSFYVHPGRFKCPVNALSTVIKKVTTMHQSYMNFLLQTAILSIYKTTQWSICF